MNLPNPEFRHSAAPEIRHNSNVVEWFKCAGIILIWRHNFNLLDTGMVCSVLEHGHSGSVQRPHSLCVHCEASFRYLQFSIFCISIFKRSKKSLCLSRKHSTVGHPLAEVVKGIPLVRSCYLACVRTAFFRNGRTQ